MDKHQTENPAGKAIHHFKVVGLLVAAKQKVPPGFSCFTNLVADRIFYWNTMQFGRTEQRVKPGAMAHRDGLEPTLSAVSRNINLILLFPGNNGPPRPPSRCLFLGVPCCYPGSLPPAGLHQGRKLHRSESWEAGRKGFCRAIIAPWST